MLLSSGQGFSQYVVSILWKIAIYNISSCSSLSCCICCKGAWPSFITVFRGRGSNVYTALISVWCNLSILHYRRASYSITFFPKLATGRELAGVSILSSVRSHRNYSTSMIFCTAHFTAISIAALHEWLIDAFFRPASSTMVPPISVSNFVSQSSLSESHKFGYFTDAEIFEVSYQTVCFTWVR